MEKNSWEDGHAPQNDVTAPAPEESGNKKIRGGYKIG